MLRCSNYLYELCNDGPWLFYGFVLLSYAFLCVVVLRSLSYDSTLCSYDCASMSYDLTVLYYAVPWFQMMHVCYYAYVYLAYDFCMVFSWF